MWHVGTSYSIGYRYAGEKEGIASTLGLIVIAAGITGLALGFKKYNEGEENGFLESYKDKGSLAFTAVFTEQLNLTVLTSNARSVKNP